MNYDPDGIEIGMWRTSTIGPKGGTKTANECVELAPIVGGGVAVRDTKDRQGAMLVFSGPEWASFIAGAKDGQFDF